MTISNYSELQSAIADRVDRTDSGPQIVEAIEAATERLSRDLRVVDQEAIADATLTDEWTSLPSDFGGMRRVTADSARLEYYTPEKFQDIVESEASPAKPIFTIEALNIRVYPAPTATDTLDVVMLYHRTVAPLVDPTDTNWVLDDHSDLYVAATMSEMCMRQKDYGAAQMWEGRAKDAILQVIIASRRRRYSGGQLVVRQG